MRFDLLSLQLFVAVSEEHSISKAADREHIAASAVSKRISDLETRLRIPLFVRSAKGLELTSGGHSLLRHARIVIRDLQQMESELGDHTAGLRGRVRVYASVSTIIQYFPRDLSEFLAANSGVRIDLQEGTSQDAVEAVAENAADIGVFGGVVPRRGLKVIPYRSDRLVVLVHRDHPLARRNSVTFEEMAEHDVIGPMKGSFLDSLVLRAASELKRPLNMPIRVNGFETVSCMVEARMGIGLVPEKCAERYMKNGATVAIDIDAPWATRQWNLCVQHGQKLPAPVRALADHLAATAQR